jgi:hypothetical protein
VSKYLKDGTLVTTQSGVGYYPQSVHVSKTLDRLYISDDSGGANNIEVRLKSDMSQLAGVSFSLPTGYKANGGIVEAGGYLFVADHMTTGIYKFDIDGGEPIIKYTFASGDAPGSLVYIDGSIFGVTVNNNVVEMDLNGNILDSWADGFDFNLYGGVAGGVTIRNGNFYVLNETVPKLRVYNSAKTLIHSQGTAGSGDGQFWAVRQLHSDADQLYATDQNNNRIQVFTLPAGGLEEVSFESPTHYDTYLPQLMESSFGGSADLWSGGPWSREELLSNDFKVSFTPDNGSGILRVDSIALRVFYTVEATDNDEGTPEIPLNQPYDETVANDDSDPAAIAASDLESPYLASCVGRNGRIVLVGRNGGIAVSDDKGATWQTADQVTEATLRGVVYGGGLYLAVGDAGVVLTSSDGLTWAAETAEVSDAMLDVAFNHYYQSFIAVGKNDERRVRTGSAWTRGEDK